MPLRRLALLVALLTAPAWAVAGCGSAPDSDVSGGAGGVGGGGDDRSSTPTATVSAPRSPASETTGPPSVSSTAGPYPAYPGRDYDYTLTVACFCAGGGTPILVSVRDGGVVEATFQGDGRGAASGDDAGGLARTIQAILDQANSAAPDRVEVVQPEGQDWPTSVTIAGAPGVADDGIGWFLSGVIPARAGE